MQIKIREIKNKKNADLGIAKILDRGLHSSVMSQNQYILFCLLFRSTLLKITVLQYRFIFRLGENGMSGNTVMMNNNV